MNKSQKTETRKDGIFIFTIDWYYDEDSTLDFMGEFVRDIGDETWYVDRHERKLYGEWLEGVRESYATHYISYGYSHNHYRYWVPGENHCPPGRNWGSAPEETKAEVIEQWGSVRRQDIEYMLEDHAYMERAADGSEWAEGYIVRMFVNGIEIDEDSLWGIWSATETYKEELITDAVDALKSEKNIRAAIAVLNNKIKSHELAKEKLNEYFTTQSTTTNE